MKKITTKIGVNKIEDFIYQQLPKYVNRNFEVDLCDNTDDYYMFKIVYENSKNTKDYIIVNDYGFQADFLYDDEQNIEDKWLSIVSKKCNELGEDLVKNYKQHKIEQHKKIVEKSVARFEKRLENLNNLDEDITM